MEKNPLSVESGQQPQCTRSQDTELPKRNAFRKASVALMKFLPQNNDPTDEDGETSPANPAAIAQDANELPKRHNPFRRASAAFMKFLPQNIDQRDEDGETSLTSPAAMNENKGKLLSTLYCKTLVLVGLVLPLAEVLVHEKNHAKILQVYYLEFYVFLCVGSLLYLIWMYASMVKDRTVINIINSYRGDEEAYNTLRRRFRGPINRYGSFYLRLGAIAFGVGSMVYSGLEFGRGLEIYNINCGGLTLIFPPTLRLLLTIGQMQFIFLNNQNMDLCSKPLLSRFGLMHLIGTNLCEWLNVVIQESKHGESHGSQHITREFNNTNDSFSIINQGMIMKNQTQMNVRKFIPAGEIHVGDSPISNEMKSLGDCLIRSTMIDCDQPTLMDSLMNDVSPFLFPCTIEYSLICAVIMLDMWMDVKKLPKKERIPSLNRRRKARIDKTPHLFTVDCANAHKGLLFGVIIFVLTIISEILYFVFKDHDMDTAQFIINVCEMVLHILSTLAIGIAYARLRSAFSSAPSITYNMDSFLIILTQFGVVLNAVFRLFCSTLIVDSDGSQWIDIATLVQSISQTVFIVHGQCLRLSQDSRPARQLISFLLPCNIASWTVNTLVHNRANSDPQLEKLFNPGAWTTVTRIAMPLAIFYRFHSTICLFEIWKNAYKRPHGTRRCR